jgi:hypothetical protein
MKNRGQTHFLRADKSILHGFIHSVFAKARNKSKMARGSCRDWSLSMRAIVYLFLMSCAASVFAVEPSLDGAWVVDLSTDPSKPYTQPMTLTLASDHSVTGSFYQSAIEAGRWKQDRGRLCASFRTSDGKGPYHTAVCWIDGKAVGQTWAEHRDFLFNWIATREGAIAR